jgi:single-strand DNA-binding protein
MAGFNKVILMGHLTRDPQPRTLPNSQTQVCDFALAVNRRWKDAEGKEREEVLFIDCSAFGKTGETIAGHLSKGRPIHVEGRLRLDRWEQEGQARSKIRVVVEQFHFVDRKPGGEATPGKAPSRARKGAKRREAPAEPVGAGAQEPAPF